MVNQPGDPLLLPPAGARPEVSAAAEVPSGRPARSVWVLFSGLGLLCAALVGLDTMVLPAALPELAWGPPRPSPFHERGAGPRPASRQADPATLTIVRREMLRAAEAQGGPQAREQLRNVWRLPPGTGGGVTQGIRVADPPRAQPPTALQRERPRTFLVPFGVHRSGPEGAGLYGASLISVVALVGLLTFLLPGRMSVVRGAVLSGGAGNLARLSAVGAVASGLFMLLGLFLNILVVGIPLAALLLFAAGPATLFGLAGVSLALGRRLMKLTGTGPAVPLSELTAGVLALFAASIIPYAGWVAFGLAAALGLGAAVVTRFGTGEPWSLSALE